MTKNRLSSIGMIQRHRVKYGLDQWTFGLLDYFLDHFFDYFLNLFFYQKVIFRTDILFIYGAEERGDGNMKMAPKQWQDWYIAAT